MRVYAASSEEALRARILLKDWAGEGFLSGAQYERMAAETVCDLRTTNVFLRIVLFLFTLISAGAAAGLVFTVFLSRPSAETTGVVLLVFAAISYAGAELAARGRRYRYGIEEALAVWSVGFLCAGMENALFGNRVYGGPANGAQFMTSCVGAMASLWIWRRFGLSYAFVAAMIFVLFLPDYWISSAAGRHVAVALFYAAGLAIVVAIRPRHRLDYLNEEYSPAEALLWLGIYLAINLQLSSLSRIEHWWGGASSAVEFSRPFYWATWVLTWCLPPIALARGVREKDRFVTIAGGIAGVLTLVTNKPYLGRPRHTWDPMLLGAALIGVAVFIRRWLAAGPAGVRHGFTAERLSGRDQRRVDVGASVFGLLSPHLAASSQGASHEVRFSGGDSGGGGASSDF